MSNLVVSEFTGEQMALIKSTVAKNATDDELRLFLYRCKIMDLDPLKSGQIHFVKYGTSPGTIIVGIEGFRSRAAKTKKHVGTKRGVLRDSAGKCVGAWCEVYRDDWKECAREEVSLSEYNTGKAQWAKMPETMIKKVAEAAALRMAFPDELGGVYTNEEMDQASEPIQSKDPSNESYRKTPVVTNVTSQPKENIQSLPEPLFTESVDEDLALVEAIVTFEEKSLAKESGFSWDKASKKWLKEMSRQEFEGNWPFEVRVVNP